MAAGAAGLISLLLGGLFYFWRKSTLRFFGGWRRTFNTYMWSAEASGQLEQSIPDDASDDSDSDDIESLATAVGVTGAATAPSEPSIDVTGTVLASSSPPSDLSLPADAQTSPGSPTGVSYGTRCFSAPN